MCKFENFILILNCWTILWVSCLAIPARIIDAPNSEWCLACICQIISGCEKNVECRKGVCGRYQINLLYWTNAGGIRLKNDTTTDPDTAFLNCVNDDECSNQIVSSYLKKYSEDCNGDGVIDCEDYMTMHLYSDRKTCQESLPRQLYVSMKECESQLKPKNDILKIKGSFNFQTRFGVDDPLAVITVPFPNTTSRFSVIVNEKCKEYNENRYTPETNSRQMDCVTSEIISNVTEFEVKEYPHTAYIGNGAVIDSITWTCSGSLISEEFVLSAAICSDLEITKWTMLADGKIYEIVQQFKHPKASSTQAINNIALFKLKTKVKFSPFIRPICLYTSTNMPDTTEKAIRTGYGHAGATESTVGKFIHKIPVSLFNDNKCKSATQEKFLNGPDLDKVICAKAKCGGNFGDSLQIQVQNESCLQTQIGIASLDTRLCVNDTEIVLYTKVSAYIDWIQPIVWPQKKL